MGGEILFSGADIQPGTPTMASLVKNKVVLSLSLIHISLARRPPNIIALIGTPSPVKNSGAMEGQFSAGAVNLEFG